MLHQPNDGGPTSLRNSATRNLGSRVASALLLALAMLPSSVSAQQTWGSLELLPAVRPANEVHSLATPLAGSSPPVRLIEGDPIDLHGDDLGCDECRRYGTRWYENASVFLGLDGSKQPQDFGINAQFGGRASINWAMPLVESAGLGVQIGTAIDATGDAVQVVQRIEGSSGRTQSFTTVGLFQRAESGLSWGVVYDFLAENYYDQFSLGQWRLDLGYQLNARNKVGVWSAIADHSDNGRFAAIPITLTPITQTNAYLKHEWAGGVQTTFWGGLANGHGQVNAVLGDLNRLNNTFVFGSELLIPLTDKLAIFGQGNFIMPASSGTVDSYLGFTYYPYGGIRGARISRYAPLQTVAAPTNFAVDLRRQ